MSSGVRRGHKVGHKPPITSRDLASPTAVTGHQNWPRSRTDDHGPGLVITAAVRVQVPPPTRSSSTPLGAVTKLFTSVRPTPTCSRSTVLSDVRRSHLFGLPEALIRDLETEGSIEPNPGRSTRSPTGRSPAESSSSGPRPGGQSSARVDFLEADEVDVEAGGRFSLEVLGETQLRHENELGTGGARQQSVDSPRCSGR